MKRQLNFDYASIHATYWMFYQVSAIFVAVYMLGKGYSNTTIGVVIAVGNITSVLLQVIISNLTDRVQKITNFSVIKLFTIVLFIVTLIAFLIGCQCVWLTIGYTVLIVIHTAMHPFLNSLSFDLEKCKVHISFGMARAMGSIFAGIMSVVMGYLVTGFGVDAIPGSGLIMIILFFGAVILTEAHYRKYCMNDGIGAVSEEVSAALAYESDAGKEKTITIRQFMLRNKVFLLMSSGIILLFFGNVILENFVIQIVEDIGGDTGQMGLVAGVGALLEAPAMLCFDRLRKKFSYTFLLRICVVFFLIKVTMFLCARSMIVIYMAQFNQILGYGLIFPAMVGFIDYIMDRGEAVRGQTIFTTAITVGQVVGMVFGGIVLDVYSVKTLLFISTIITIAGALLIFILVKGIEQKAVSRNQSDYVE